MRAGGEGEGLGAGLSWPAAAGTVDQLVPVPWVLGNAERRGGEGMGGMAIGNGGGRPYGIGGAATNATAALCGRRGRGPPPRRVRCGAPLWRRLLPGGAAGQGERGWYLVARWGAGGAERRGGPPERGVRGTRARVCRRRGVPARPPTSAAGEAAAVAVGARTGCTWRREAQVHTPRSGKGGGAGRWAERASRQKRGSRRTRLSSGVLTISTAALSPWAARPAEGAGDGTGGKWGRADWSPAAVPPLEPLVTPGSAAAPARRGPSFSDVSGYHHRELIAASYHHVGATPRPISHLAILPALPLDR